MEGWGEKRRHGGRKSSHGSIEHAINEIAARQHRVVSLEQLTGLGLSASATRSRVAGGRLQRIQRGVFIVGPGRPTAEGRWIAAVLACGPGAALSQRSAGGLLAMRADSRATIDVTTPRSGGRKRPGIDIHRSRGLLPRDITIVDGIPCTTVARTLLDLAEVIDRRGLERAIDRAEILRTFDMRAIEDVLDRTHGRRGGPILRAVLGEHDAGTTLTASKLEELFLGICRTAHLPRPEVNVWVPLLDEEFKVDFMWRTQRLIVEVDGRETHGTRRAFEEDRRRDQRLTLAGYRVIRITWRQVTSDPEGVAQTLRALLAHARPVA